MNAKIRSILHTAWTEPRHFFFWLALLSLSCFAVVAAFTALTQPPLVLAFVALASILCFLVGIAAFMLAWIPPVRRLLAWLLRRRVLVLACLATLVALFYTVENWRGRRAWQSFKGEREAKGDRVDIASLLPPPVPKDQNFFETPLWSHLHFVKTNGSTVWSETGTNWHRERVLFDAFGPKANNAPGTGNWMKAERVDLAAWQAFYRGTNNLFAAPSGPPTNYFPVAREPQAPAADVLLALSRFETNRQLLIAAAARPQARFWCNYEDGFAALLPHLAPLKASSLYLWLHADAALKAGDRQTALEDVHLMFRLIESVRNEPLLISHLVRIAMLPIALQPVWEGLADRQWTEADLSFIERELGKLDFLADCQFAMRGERAWDVWAVDFIRKLGGLEIIEDTPWQGQPSWAEELGRFLGKAAFRLMPAGWFDRNKLSLCRYYEHYLLPLVIEPDRRIAPKSAIEHSDLVLKNLRWNPFNMLGRILLPALGHVADKFARGQAWADLARVACALERYRLANGQFPETLDALAPKFIAKLPHDVINGQPLKYRRTDDGRFVLYSVGSNETDDGGKVGLTKNGNLDWSKGDWVWRYPAR